MGSSSRAGRATGGGAYFLGMIGAVVYYMQEADGFWSVIWGLLRSLVWPAFAVHHLLGL